MVSAREKNILYGYFLKLTADIFLLVTNVVLVYLLLTLIDFHILI